jgi:hypothetical protein
VDRNSLEYLGSPTPPSSEKENECLDFPERGCNHAHKVISVSCFGEGATREGWHQPLKAKLLLS